MTVPGTALEISYTGNDVTTAFPYTFPIILTTDIHVYITDLTGVETETTNFELDTINSEVNYPLTGDPLPTGYTIRITRIEPITQLLDLINQGTFSAENLEKALDKLTMIAQQLNITSQSGYSGYSGQDGASGFSGYSGIDGVASASGYSGFSGYSGYSGDNPGSSGYSGYSGLSGYSGYSGDNPGTSGYSGYSGYSGQDGAAASSGYSGYSGARGQSGYSGYSGFSGIDASTQNIIFCWNGVLHGDTSSPNQGISQNGSSGYGLELYGGVGRQSYPLIRTKIKKQSGINTLTVYAYMRNNSGFTSRSGVLRTTVNAIATDMSTTSPTGVWVSTTIDISALTSDTIYDMTFGVGLAGVGTYWGMVSAIIVIGS